MPMADMDSRAEEDRLWHTQIRSAIKDWIGTKFSDFGPNQDSYVKLIKNELEGTVDGLIDKFRADVFDLCPYAEIRVVDKCLDKAWDKLSFECRLGGDVVRDLNERILLESARDQLQISVWKKREGRDRALVGSVTVALNEVHGNEPQKWPVKDGKSAVGWLKLAVELHNRNKEPASKLLPSMISDHLAHAYATHLVSDNIRVSQAFLGVKYCVRVRKNIIYNAVSAPMSVSGSNAMVEHQSQKLTSDVVFIPINNLAQDSFVLQVNESSGKPSNRLSAMLLHTPTKKDKRKSTEVLYKTLASTLVRDNSLITESEEKTIRVDMLPWKGRLRVLQRGWVEWIIEVEGQFREDVENLLNSKASFKRLYACQLSQMSEAELLDWDGCLKTELAAIDCVLKPFYMDNNEEARNDAMVELHDLFEFNNEIMFSIVCDMVKNGRGPSLDARMNNYVNYCWKTFLGINWRKLSLDFYRVQLHYIIQNLNVFFHDSDVERRRQVGQLLDALWEKDLRTQVAATADLLAFLRDHVARVLRKIEKTLGKHCHWVPLLANLVLQKALDHVLAETAAGASNTHMFNLFLMLRKVSEHSSTAKDKIFAAFEPLLSVWAASAVDKAKEQVGRVLAMEKEKHDGAKEAYWSDADDVNRLETSINVNGIFESVQLTWREISWPDPVANVEFGTRLFSGLHEVFKQYVEDFLDIVLKEDTFEKHDFVIILNNVLHGMVYLKSNLEQINAAVEQSGKEENREQLRVKVKNFSEVFASAVIEADDKAESIVTRFCECQRPLIRRLIADTISEDQIAEGRAKNSELLLEHLNVLLEFLHRNLNQESGDKYRRMTKTVLLEIVDQELEEAFAALKKKKTPELFSPLIDVIPQTVEFRRNLSIDESPVLAKIQNELYPRSTPTPELICKLLADVCADSAAVAVAKVKLKVGLIKDKDQVLVNLVLIDDVKPWGQNNNENEPSNFSMTLSVLPLKKSPYILRQKTACFKRCTSFTFQGSFSGIDRASAKGNFVLNLPTNSYDLRTTVLVLELCHHFPMTFQKVSSGLAHVPLFGLPSVSTPTEVRYLKVTELRLLKIAAKDSVELMELKGRGDSQSKMFVKRYERVTLGKSVFESHDWAKVDDTQLSADIISDHLQELMECEEDIAQATGSPQSSRLGDVDIKLAFNETTEELHVDIVRILNLRPRIDQDDINFNVGVRVVPTKLQQNFTRIYPSALSHEFNSDDARIVFSLDTANYNYHKTFVEVILYDNTRSAFMGMRADRYFRGHVLIPLTSVHPIDMANKLASVTAKRFRFHAMSTRLSDLLTQLERKKDALAKAYVEELHRHRDGLGVKVTYVKEDWADPLPKTTSELISSHLEKLRVQQLYSASQSSDSFGRLRFVLGFDERTSRLFVELRSVTDVKPIDGQTTCNFCIVMVVLPSTKSPYVLRESTLVYPRRTCLLFDLQDDFDDDSGQRRDNTRHKFHFDLSKGEFNQEQTYVMFELYFHLTTVKFFRGAFVVSLSSVARVRPSEGDLAIHKLTKSPRKGSTFSLSSVGAGRNGSNASFLPSGPSTVSAALLGGREQEGYFVPLPKEDFEEFLELEARTDSEAKAFVESYNKNRSGKSISKLFTLHEWAKV